ncbi:MAG: DUF692 domain-containing protein [Polyangiaceae bacterium]|nr:DUF692 domain-containing protein [Polyangiaceae bacterium]
MSAEARRTPGHGVGLGLRWEFIEDLVDRVEAGRAPELPFLEVHPENYLGRGGYVREALEFLAERYPILTHGLTLDIGGVEPLDQAYLRALRAFLERVRAPWHSDHLCFTGSHSHELLPVPRTRALVTHVAARARAVEDALGLPLVLENVSAYLELGASELDEPAFVAAVLEASGCALLLDVNNVWVNAQNFGFDPHAWLARVDYRRVRAMHVAGHERRPELGLVIDTHGAEAPPMVHELLELAVARSGPVPVVLERDAHVPPLDVLLAEVAALGRAYARGLARAGAGPVTATGAEASHGG